MSSLTDDCGPGVNVNPYMDGELTKAYRPLIGKRPAHIVWRPMNSDTEVLAKDLAEDAVCFTGAVTLGFDDGMKLSLTWMNAAVCYLSLNSPCGWREGSLGTFPTDSDGPWGALFGESLIGVMLFSHESTQGQVVAARHVLKGQIERDLWIGVGSGKTFEESDDLVACVGGDPDNLDELDLVALVDGKST